jgi:hypothetical protein
MPLAVSATTGGVAYASPMVGRVDQVLNKKIDLSLLTTDEVDSAGYLKPGCIFKESGNLLIPVGAAAGVPFVVPEATKLNVTVPPTNTTLGAETGDHMIGVVTHGVVNRDIAEDCKGIAYTANELASFVLAGSNLTITTT